MFDSIDESLNKFRISSRELFNHYFRSGEPERKDGWTLEGRFAEVQQVLFQQLVTESASLTHIPYGDVQCDILVRLRRSNQIPIMLNRSTNSGYWDYPITNIQGDATLKFICFFDWDQLAWRDNRYVRVIVERWPAHPETVGKHGLIESQYVEFTTALAR